MQAVTVESTLSVKLEGLSGQAFLCDSEGRVLGAFSPWPERPRLSDLNLEPPSSLEELQELRKVRTGKPLEEILARFGL
jgi:hypothetical protein